MSEFKRQHPVSAIAGVIDLIRDNLVTIIIILVFGAGGGGPSFIWMFASLFVLLLLLGVAGWWRFQYRIEDGELQIRRGVLVRRNLYLTRDRVQVIDVTSGLVQRLFGLVKVEIKTAGSSSREASLSAVSKREAELLTQLLRKTSHATASTGEEAAEPDAAQPEKRFLLPLKDLLLAASTSGSFGIALSIIATIFSQLEPLLDENQMLDWLMAATPGEADATYVVMLILLFVLFAWLLSFFGTLLRYGGFVLTVQEDEMVINRGIIEKKHITVPYNRVQAVRIVEGIFRQPFGYATVYVESAGYGDARGSGSVVLFPLVKRSEIEQFLDKILPDYTGSLPALTPPPRALRRYIVRSSAVLALAVAAAWWLFNSSAWIWLLMLPGLWWGYLRYRDAAVGTDGGRIIIRDRVLARTTSIVRRNRAQDVSALSSLVQQWRDLAHLEVSVASGDQGRRFRVRELERDDALQLLPWLSVGGGRSGDDSSRATITADLGRGTGAADKHPSQPLLPDW